MSIRLKAPGLHTVTWTIGGVSQTPLLPPPTATIRLVKRSNLQVAPEGFIFEVDLLGFDSAAPADATVYDPQFHDIEYFWNFGDPGATFTAPVNVVAHQRNADAGYGPNVAHVYNSPGGYTVSVLVYEKSSGKTAAGTFVIGTDTPSIGDPDTLFAGGKTFVADTTGTGLPAYPGSVTYITIDAAVAALAGKADPHRIIVRDGQNFTTTSHLPFGSTVPATHLVREGGGTMPVVNRGGGTRVFDCNTFDVNSEKDLVINGIEFVGGWDATTETGTTQVHCIQQSTNQGDYLLVHNAKINKFDHAYVALSTTDDIGVRIFSNTSVEGCRTFPFYEEMNSPSAYLGVLISAGADALAGGPRTGTHNGDSACIRFQSAKNSILDGCDFYNETGWYENYFGFQSAQQVIRVDQRNNTGSRINIQRCSFEGFVSFNRMNAGDPADLMNGLCERSIFTHVPFMTNAMNLQLAIHIERGGVTVRNNYFLIPDGPRIDFYGAFSPAYVVGMTLPTTGNVAGNAAAPIRAYNNTAVSLRSAVEGFPVVQFLHERTPGDFLSVSDDNNILHAPNQATPLTADAPFATIAIWTPRNDGYRSAFERIETTLATPVAPGAVGTFSYPPGRGQADYVQTPPNDSHRIGFSDLKSPSAIQGATATFGVSDFTLRNDSGTEWPAGTVVMVLFCATGSAVHLTEYATNGAPLTLYRPDTGSAAIAGATTGLVAHGDFYGAVRSGTPSRGAFEPV